MTEQFKYIIVGGGMVAGHAAKQIRKEDEKGSLLVLSSDEHAPYKRPPLSKSLWISDSYTEDKLPFKATEDDSIEFRTNTTVVKLNRQDQEVETEDGSKIAYEKLLLATGGSPRKIDGPDTDRVMTYRYRSDYQKLSKLVEDNKDIIVIGGGFIGSEIAAALNQNDVDVTMIFPEESLGSNKFPKGVVRDFEATFRENGVKIIGGTSVKSYIEEGDRVAVKLDDGREVSGDVIVFGLGITPNTDLAEEAGLEVDNGVVVNEQLQTKDENIWAAGDIANYPDKILGRRRIEHEDHARASGKKAGKNLTGASEDYTYTPMFYSDVFDTSYEAIGTLDSSLETIIDPVGDGKVVYYLENDKPVGILIWNTSISIKEAKEALSNPPEDSTDLKGLIKEKTD